MSEKRSQRKNTTPAANGSSSAKRVSPEEIGKKWTNKKRNIKPAKYESTDDDSSSEEDTRCGSIRLFDNLLTSIHTDLAKQMNDGITKAQQLTDPNEDVLLSDIEDLTYDKNKKDNFSQNSTLNDTLEADKVCNDMEEFLKSLSSTTFSTSTKESTIETETLIAKPNARGRKKKLAKSTTSSIPSENLKSKSKGTTVTNTTKYGRGKRTTRNSRSKENSFEDAEVIISDHEAADVKNGNLVDNIKQDDMSFFNVRVRWRNEIFKFKFAETDFCYEIKKKLAESLNLMPNELLIFYEENDSPTDMLFDDNKTLKEANIRLGTILGAIKKVGKTNSSSSSTSTTQTSKKTEKKVRDPNLIRIKVQSTERRSEAYYELKKNSHFSELLAMYCNKMNLEPDNVKFMFDGEFVNLGDTPEDLELEGDECFDVFVKK